MNLRTLTSSSVSPEFVLEVIRDEHRQACEFDPEAEPDSVLGFETTIAEWQYACDLVDWKPLRIALNSSWNIDASDSDWQRVLTPENERTLRDLCGFIADQAAVESAAVPVIQGKACPPAGMFFAVREILENGGADVRKLRPSSSLEPFCRKHLDLFLGPVSRLAPGRLPVIKISQPLYDVALALLVLSWLTAIILSLLGNWLIGLGIYFVAYLALRLNSRFSTPRSIGFGSLQTFRDLSETLSSGKGNP